MGHCGYFLSSWISCSSVTGSSEYFYCFQTTENDCRSSGIERGENKIDERDTQWYKGKLFIELVRKDMDVNEHERLSSCTQTQIKVK